MDVERRAQDLRFDPPTEQEYLEGQVRIENRNQPQAVEFRPPHVLEVLTEQPA